jgi:hypothetical protein
MIIESTNYFVGNASSQAVYSGNVVHFPNLVRVLSCIRTLNPPGGAALCSFKSGNMWPFFPPPRRHHHHALQQGSVFHFGLEKR